MSRKEEKDWHHWAGGHRNSVLLFSCLRSSVRVFYFSWVPRAWQTTPGDETHVQVEPSAPFGPSV